MEDEFYGDTISVELAIQRELAYRRKLALHLNPNDDFLKDLIPLELESTTPSFDPIENQPSSSVVPSGSKRKEPEEQQSFTGSETLGISASTGDDLHCKLCNVECSSHFNLKQHLTGHKHRAKLEESAKGQRQWCHICGVPCANEDCLKMHFEGKKHKAKVLELGLTGVTGCGGQLVEHVPAEQRRGVYCDVCRVWCADEGCFKQHLEGRKHKLQIYDPHKG